MLKHFQNILITLLVIFFIIFMVSPVFAESAISSDSTNAAETTAQKNTELGFELYSPHILLMEASSRKNFV